MPAQITPQQFGARLREARKARGLHQKHLADASGTTQPYISLLEKGEVDEPSVYVVRDLERTLDLFPGCLTEPEGHRLSRLAAIAAFMEKRGAELGLTDRDRADLDWKLAAAISGDAPPSEYVLTKGLEYLRALRVGDVTGR